MKHISSVRICRSITQRARRPSRTLRIGAALSLLGSAVAVGSVGSAPQKAFAAPRTSQNLAYVNYDDSGFTESSPPSANIFTNAITDGPGQTSSPTDRVSYTSGPIHPREALASSSAQLRTNATVGASYNVPSTASWVDTGLDVHAGDTIKVSASGSWSPALTIPFAGPDGQSMSQPDNYLNLTDIGSCGLCAHTPTPHWGSLVGYIGSSPPGPGSYTSANVLVQAKRVFFIGANFTGGAPQSGRLWLAFNDDAYSGNTGDNRGSVTADVSVITGPTPPAILNSFKILGSPKAQLVISFMMRAFDVYKCALDFVEAVLIFVGVGGLSKNPTIAAGAVAIALPFIAPSAAEDCAPVFGNILNVLGWSHSHSPTTVLRKWRQQRLL